VVLVLQRSLVLQGPGLVGEQTDPEGRKVHKLVQHLARAAPAKPGSQASPASITPSPQTDLAAADAKSGVSGTTTEIGDESTSTSGVSLPVGELDGPAGADEVAAGGTVCV